MSQAAFARAFDATLHGALAGAGLADAGSYLPPGGNPLTDAVPCGVFIDRGIQQMGDFGQVVGAKDMITLLRADVASPQQGAIVTVYGEAFRLESEENSDDGTSRWVASHV